MQCVHGDPQGARACALCRADRPQWAQQAATAALPFDDGLIPDNLTGPDRLVYAARIQALFGLPYAKTDATSWVRTNGPMALEITAGLSTRPNGERTQALPYGKAPRMLMMWLTTQAVLQQSPVVTLGDSLRGFTQAVGLGNQNSKRRSELLDQLRRLVALTYTFRNSSETAISGHELIVTRPLVDSAEIWFSKGDATSEHALIDSQITLGEKFYSEFVQNHALPVRLEHLSQLDRRGDGGMALDIYLWLAYRTNGIQRPTMVSWNQISAQFGSGYTRLRDFRDSFRANLDRVLNVYGEFDVQETQGGITLKRSKSPVATRHFHHHRRPVTNT